MDRAACCAVTYDLVVIDTARRELRFPELSVTLLPAAGAGSS